MGLTLTIVFIILKAVGVIAWSWFLVLVPVIIEVVLWVLWCLFIAIMAALGLRN